MWWVFPSKQASKASPWRKCRWEKWVRNSLGGGEQGHAKCPGQVGGLIRPPGAAGCGLHSASSPGVQLAPPVSGNAPVLLGCGGPLLLLDLSRAARLSSSTFSGNESSHISLVTIKEMSH